MIADMVQNTQTRADVDKRAIHAIIRAVNTGSFVVSYADIYDQLKNIIDDEDEFDRVEFDLYDRIASRSMRYVKRITAACDTTELELVAVAPCELDDDEWGRLYELGDLFLDMHDNNAHDSDRDCVRNTVDMLIRASCKIDYKASGDDVARAVYNALAREYDIDEDYEDIVK
jgi:hypothetical protein